ncbi:MAG: RNA-guided endonuclease IscB [Crinalium sp.]
MSKVFVLNTNKQPLNPVHPGRARILLSQEKAAVFRRYPFTIILKSDVNNPKLEPLRIKLDPGAKTTGIALLNDNSGKVVWAAELTHRGFQIRDALTSRRQFRHSRRNRKTRYRQPRFNHRRRRDGWLPPSLQSRIENIKTWVARLRRLAPITAISQELVKFDTQLMENPEISGAEYQQGELKGYEVREYLLEKFNRKCIYCDATDTKLEIEHLIPKSKGGSNRVSNLGLACRTCNQSKGNRDIAEFLSDQPDLLKRILSKAKKPLADTAAVNTTRWALFRVLKETGLAVETGTGGRTKYNRQSRNIPKSHWTDAACVGASTPETLILDGVVPLQIKANGKGNRFLCQSDKFGFPKRTKQGQLVKRERQKVYFGFQTGDMVKAIVKNGKHAGIHVGKVTVRKSGAFDITTEKGRLQSIRWKYCQPIHRHDGYSYAPLPTNV